MRQLVIFSFLVVLVFVISGVKAQVPTMVQDINPNGDGFADYMTAVGSDVFFRATNNTFGSELWKYDGNEAVVVDINQGVGSSNPVNLVSLDSSLVFVANSGIEGSELWQYDGTSSSLIRDIFPGSSSSSPSELTVYKNELYFRAKDGSKGSELWKYNGDTVMMVQDIKSGAGSSLPLGLRVIGDYLYFTANDGTHGLELWKYDGIGAVMVMDIWNGAASAFGSESYLIEFGSEVYFAANDGLNGSELWRYDGDTAVMVADINLTGSSNPEHLTVLGTDLYFAADDGIHGAELWKYNGDTAVMVQDIRVGPDGSDLSRFSTFQSEVYFAANDGVNPLTLCKSDGDTIVHVADDPSDFFDPNFMTVFQDKLYFTVNTNAFGSDLVAYDGTTISQLDLNTGTGASAASNFEVIGCSLYFEAKDNDVNGKELWVLSGVDNGITQIGETLSANTSGATYQWLECSNNNQPVAGATGQSFAPTKNGSYAVQITEGGCTTISTCVNMTVVGLEDLSTSPIKVYPTISEGFATIDLGAVQNEVSISVRNINGQLMATHGPINAAKQLDIVLPQAKGLYFVEVKSANTASTRFKVIKR
ncbi:MAG: T9SS type A sorting domain-containing protein [Cyclobacteriaceae bacterium]